MKCAWRGFANWSAAASQMHKFLVSLRKCPPCQLNHGACARGTRVGCAPRTSGAISPRRASASQRPLWSQNGAQWKRGLAPVKASAHRSLPHSESTRAKKTPVLTTSDQDMSSASTSARSRMSLGPSTKRESGTEWSRTIASPSIQTTYSTEPSRSARPASPSHAPNTSRAAGVLRCGVKSHVNSASFAQAKWRPSHTTRISSRVSTQGRKRWPQRRQ
mmetsp:Transcript_119159/g.337808  ORF Transcript_119159/g.337808 Transcript_119159/m.337808 type:complete len:218 (+) Transcript_119159:412-1065(+)